MRGFFMGVGRAGFCVYIPYLGCRLFTVPPLRQVTYLSGEVTKTLCSWLGSSCVGVPSRRRRSVGPPPSAIPWPGRLSRHPCRSASLRAACVRPAPKLRLAESGLSRGKSRASRVETKRNTWALCALAHSLALGGNGRWGALCPLTRSVNRCGTTRSAGTIQGR